MTQRIIIGQAAGIGDAGLTPELHKVFVDSLEAVLEAGDGPAFMSTVRTLSDIHAANLPADQQGRFEVLRFIASLPQPQRRIVAAHLHGQTATEIAKSTGLGRKPVCKLLAKIYSKIQTLLPC